MTTIETSIYSVSTYPSEGEYNKRVDVKYKKGKPNAIITTEYFDNGSEKSTVKQKWDEKTQSWVTTREITYFTNGWLESFKRISRKHPKKTAEFTFYENANLKSVERINKKGEVTTHKEYNWKGKRIKD